jgi:serine protease Do
MSMRFGLPSVLFLMLVTIRLGVSEDTGAPAAAPHTAAGQTRGPAQVADSEPPPVTLPLSAQLKRIFAGVPADLADLKAMQAHVQKLSERVITCTVAVRMRGAMGSAVIVSPDGYVLCAGHVIGKPGREVTLIFPDGREVRAKTLGANFGIDSGLIKITTEGTWPYAELGSSASVRRGQWCLTTGHPGGYQRDRSPPVRLGRVLLNEPGAIVTDCPLVGGDSGGPLFDMQGRVIGIHSRIADDLLANLHVPVDTYRDTWKRLVASEVWGGLRPGGPVIGVIHDDKVDEARIAGVLPDSPAQGAGIRAGDVITKFDNQEIKLFRELAEAVSAKEPGDRVRIEVRRDERTLELELVIGSFDL